MSAELDRVKARLEGVRGNQARCPGPKHKHGDRRPSLTVNDGREAVVLKCHTGCPTETILSAIGLTMADLRYDRRNGAAPPERRIVETYPYRDESGTLLYEVVRYSPKDFRQRRPDGHGGWVWSLGNTRRVLFRLPETIEAVALDKTILIPEGERDVLALTALGFAATCNSGGAGKWRDEFGEVLRGARVVVIPDADLPGEQHAQDIARSVYGKAASVKVVRLGGDA